VIARRHQQAGVAVGDHFRNTAGGGRDDSSRAGHRVEQRRAEAFGDGTHHEDIEALETTHHVGAESRQKHVLFEMVIADLAFELLAKLAFAENDEAGIRDFLDDQVCRLDQVALAFVRHERRDIADDRRMMWKPEGCVNVNRRDRDDTLDVDAFVNRDRLILRDTIGEQNAADGFGRGDEAVDLPVFPS